ncbi:MULTISPECIES: hypothetical protein [Cupriavidus]|uniref:Rap1a immunity protein domain-containing protein n=1 Tax=Cupriavidus oxalaticus TaxID=96344 RepID=A0A5P3VSF1_9BURK|nr:hypothetical protein [Cupriavidus oxalaticus]QEZ48905.1 hypothetical protein D2917_32090 [Cupriavidus oxalaticus]
MSRYQRSLLAILIAACSGSAQAEVNLGDFREMVSVAKTENDRAILNLYLSGVLGAYGWANATLAARHQPLLFCAPATPPLLPEHAQNMLLEIPLNELNKGMPASLMLAGALQRAFPCKR